MKKSIHKLLLISSCIGVLGTFPQSVASSFTDPSQPPRVSKGVLTNVQADRIDQTFNDTGPKGGNAVINFGNQDREKRPQDYFEEGRKYFYMEPPNYYQAQTYFLRAAGAEEKHIKIDSYLHCAKCVLQSDPDSARIYYKNVIDIEDRDEAYRGLMKLDYYLSLDADDDPEYFQEVLERAISYGQKIGSRTKEDRQLIKKIQQKLSSFSMPSIGKSLDALTLNEQKPSPEQTLTDDGDISTLSGESVENIKKGTFSSSPSNASLSSLVSEAKRGVKKARLALETLAEEGDFEACLAMISLYEEGIVIKRDPSKIFYFMCQAAEAGSDEYQMKVGKAYQEGQGVSQDLEEALRYYRLAALNDNTEAMVFIAHIYASIQGFKNEGQALDWYLKAAKKGNPQGVLSLAQGYATSSWGLHDKDPKALEWYLKAGDNGSPEVWYNLGLSFEKGTSLTPFNEYTAFSWYAKAALSDHFLSLQKVVEFYIQERAGLGGVSSEAITWYYRGALQNDMSSVIELSLCYLNEYGGLLSTSEEAIQWYAKAAAFGNQDSLFKLAESYIAQIAGLQKVSNDALRIYEQAGGAGHIGSQLQLGEFYKEGKGGVSKNNDEAKRWYMMAAQQGSSDARSILESGVLEKPLLPKIADGYEQVYKRFMNGALVYKPNENNTQGMLTFPFRDWVNPETLKGTCDLSRCGDAGNYLIINSGYRTRKSGSQKIEVYIMPRFLVEKELGRDFGQHKAIKNKWTSEVGILFSWGTWDDNSWGEYQTKDTFDEISTQNLYNIISHSPNTRSAHLLSPHRPSCVASTRERSSKISIQFLDNI